MTEPTIIIWQSTSEHSESEPQWYFHLKGGNGETQLQSEGYTTKEDARRGVVDAYRNFTNAMLDNRF